MMNKEEMAQRPERFCKFCKSSVSWGKLKRHITRKHKGETEVQTFLKMSSSEQRVYMTNIRKKGTYFNNKKTISCGEGSLMRERQSKNPDDLRMCSTCQGFYSSRTFRKHRHQSCGKSAFPLQVAVLNHEGMSYHKDEGFVVDILNRFHDDLPGKLCRSNDLVKEVGYRHYCLRRNDKDKVNEVRKNIMGEMRMLARLFLQVNVIREEEGMEVLDDFSQLFTRPNLASILQASETLASGEGGEEKYGTKLLLHSVIKRTIKILKAIFCEKVQPDKQAEIENFAIVFDFRAPEIFGSARQKSEDIALNKNRRPEALPDETDVLAFKQFLEKELLEVKAIANRKEYIWLRNLIICRLTLYNCRRGDEPSRLTINQFQDALDDIWIPSDRIECVKDQGEKYLIGQFKLAYLRGKGKKFVPILLPLDIVESMKLLASARPLYVDANNEFFFGTASSGGHCSGWHAIQEVCKRAVLQGIDCRLINATKFRHRISTIYASLDMTTKEKDIFLKHMGHEGKINEENYQCPLGFREVAVMGRLLSAVDEGETSGQQMGETTVCEAEENGSLARRTNVSDAFEKPDESVLSTECQKKMKKNATKTIQVRWSNEETAQIKDFFHEHISSEGNNNSGTLPSKSEIISFLKVNKLACLEGLDFHTQYQKTRVKVFNERKKLRDRAELWKNQFSF